MNETALVIIGVIVVLAIAMFLSRFLMMRAFSTVIKIFQEYNAINDKNAKTIDELGLRPPSFTQRMFRARDYKPQALNILIRADIIQTTEDGKLYLSEENLSFSKFKNLSSDYGIRAPKI